MNEGCKSFVMNLGTKIDKVMNKITIGRGHHSSKMKIICEQDVIIVLYIIYIL